MSQVTEREKATAMTTRTVRSDETRCEFTPRNGHYYDQCRETATWYVPNRSTQSWGGSEYRRCDRHLAVDKRTAAKRGYDLYPKMSDYIPFDAEAAFAAAVKRDQERDQQARRETLARRVALLELELERDFSELKSLNGIDALKEQRAKIATSGTGVATEVKVICKSDYRTWEL